MCLKHIFSMSFPVCAGIGFLLVLAIIGLAIEVRHDSLKSEPDKRMYIVVGVLQAISIILYLTGLLDRIAQMDVYLAFYISAVIYVVCIVISVWMVLPTSKYQHGIKYLFLFLLTLTGCGQRKPPVLYVQVEDLKNNSVLTQALTSSGRKKKVSSFYADAARVYQVSPGSLHSDIVNGKVRNTISDLTILDSETHPVHDALLEDIAEVAAASIDHDIMEFEIWNVGTRYYSFIKLNVNWSNPCELYEYHSDSHSIRLAGAWDNVNLLGMALPE